MSIILMIAYSKANEHNTQSILRELLVFSWKIPKFEITTVGVRGISIINGLILHSGNCIHAYWSEWLWVLPTASSTITSPSSLQKKRPENTHSTLGFPPVDRFSGMSVDFSWEISFLGCWLELFTGISPLTTHYEITRTLESLLKIYFILS